MEVATLVISFVWNGDPFINSLTRRVFASNAADGLYSGEKAEVAGASFTQLTCKLCIILWIMDV